MNYFCFRVHFIPLSSSYKEIYNIYSFFSGPPESVLDAANSTLAGLPAEERRSPEGDKRLRRIARAGKIWKQTMGRKVDMEGKRLVLLYYFELDAQNLLF